MIVEELAARFGFTVDGIDKVRRAIAVLGRLQKAILMVAAAIAKRLARVGSILVRTTAAAVAFGSAFVTSSALITAAAGAASLALAGMAATFAKLRQSTIDSAFLSGVPVQELALIEKLMTRIGASAKDGRSFIADFAKKVREGAKEGGDWADALAKQGVKLKDAKGKAKLYSNVIDDILRAADKIKDADKRRDFLKEGLEGAPDELIAQLLQATSALKRYEALVTEARKAGGNMSLGDVLNSQDITNSLGKIATALQGFVDAFGSGVMASFAQGFREFGDAVVNFATDERRAKFRQFAGDLSQFFKDVNAGGALVLNKVASAIGSIVDVLQKMDDATGGRLGMLAKGVAALGAVIATVAASPILAVSAAITALLYAVAKFQEWKEGGKNALSDFFEAIASAADSAKQAITGLLETLKGFPGLGGMSPKAPAGAEGNQRLKSYMDGLERLDLLRKKSTELSPGSVASKLASDRARSGGAQAGPISATATSTATFNGIFDATAAHKIQGMIDKSITEASAKLAVSLGKATNARAMAANGSSSP